MPARLKKLLLLAGAIGAVQFILYGPSLVGSKLLLPLDLLAGQGMYLPRTPEIAAIQPQNETLADLVLIFEPARRFAISEWRAGRLPMWAPYEFAGAPTIWPKFSPFLGIACLTESPVVLAWAQLLGALVAGLGAYVFFRRVLGVGFWPAFVCANCYPLTGFFIFWVGSTPGLAVYWLPWVLLAVDGTVNRSNRLAPIGLSFTTCLTLISGQLDIGGQVLLASGLFAVWRLVQRHCRPWQPRQLTNGVVRLSGAWLLGILLATPSLLPTIEYSRTSARLARRGAGEEERPPVGVTALPQVVLPDTYGRCEPPSLRFAGEWVQQESSAAAYAGLLATLVAAPLAFCSKRHFGLNTLWTLAALLGVSWCLNLPGVVSVLRWPGLNMMSHNRLVFLTCLAVLALAAVGLEVLWRESFQWQKWMWLWVGLLAGLGIWCTYRTVTLPEPLATEAAKAVVQGGSVGWIHDLAGAKRAQASFIQYHALAAVWCGAGVIVWICLRRRALRSRLAVLVLGGLLLLDLVCFAYGRNVQCDPALYYPPIAALRPLSNAAPGRVMGYGCLPANLASMCGLRDIRGYDAVDPSRLVALELAAGEPTSARHGFGATLELVPKVEKREGQLVLSPILDMLGVRYVIFRGRPSPDTPVFSQGLDYFVVENLTALPRVFIPHHVECVADDTMRLGNLTSPTFNPREVAYVETPVELPNRCRGEAKLVSEVPTRLTLSAHMETAGLVVLADLWDKGWKAWVDGKPVPILRANHAVRGVVLPAGMYTLEFRYQPPSFTWGLRLAALAAITLLAWAVTGASSGSRPNPAPDKSAHPIEGKTQAADSANAG